MANCVCPNCSATMRTALVDGSNVDACDNCGGTWFDGGELRLLVEKDPLELDKLDSLAHIPVDHQRIANSRLLCPIDDVLLDKYHYMYTSPVIVHACHHCEGCFIAEGDLARMQIWREQAERPMTPQEEAGVALGTMAAAHQKEMFRLQNTHDFFTVLKRYTPGWFGLVP